MNYAVTPKGVDSCKEIYRGENYSDRIGENEVGGVITVNVVRLGYGDCDICSIWYT